jgi:hypothetical protein
MKRVQLAGAETAIEQVLVGLERELRVDLDNDSLRLHDGIKPGGYEFLNRDQSDGRYQRRSLELDGFNFGAQGKGILVRVSPSNYKLRKLESLDQSLVFENPVGTAGNFNIELNPTVPTDHTWAGEQTYQQPIQAEGGVVGNVTGDLTGDSFGTHTGPSNGTHTGPTNGSHTGDVDVRGADFVTDDGQILETQIDPQAWIRRGIPYGGIIMWAGLVDDIPDSWALCNGDNGTPDLRDRFVIGAGDTYDTGAIGGTSNHTHTGTLALGGAHNHVVIVGDHALTIAEMPAHNHANGVCDAGPNCFNHGSIAASPPAPKQFDTNSGTGSVEGISTNTGGGGTHTHEDSETAMGGDHAHDLTLDAATLLPPYYALCYIMKIV